jgi:hypothetical protein
MAANSVSGSFRGIEVSFTYSGPHIVMSVSNTTGEDRRLRVMYQQQPLSGRVNWTSLQLARQTQDVIVPSEVIQSHKLAFYVDNHEPIATYTEKVLEELEELKAQQTPEVKASDSTPEYEQQTLLDIHTSPVAEDLQEISVSTNGSNNRQHAEEKAVPDKNSEVTGTPLIPQTAIEPELNNADVMLNGPASIELAHMEENPNDDDIQITQHEDLQDETTPKEELEVESIPKRKTPYIGQYVPNVSTELQFKIKVPLLPKSASKKQTTFIPPRSVSKSASKMNKQGFVGQLFGAFGLPFSSKKKAYFMQQNQSLYEKFHSELEKLESDYNNGCGIPLDNWDLKSLNEQQAAILLLNLMVNEISEWKKSVKQRSETKETLAKSLEDIEKELKQTLKHTRGIHAPAPTLFPDRTAASDQDLMHIQEDCDSYLERFTEKLAVLEQKHAEKVRVSAFKKFLLEFVRDRLFPVVAEFSSQKSVQSRLNWFLDLIDYELMPIEPGKTKFSPEYHEVKEKRSTDFESDTIVEVVAPGLQVKGGKRVIQNAVVIQAE